MVIWFCVCDEDEVCDRMRDNDPRCIRVKRASATVVALSMYMLGSTAAELTTFNNARNEAKTICVGLLVGQRFERIECRAAVLLSGARNEGPPAMF